jgi:hypothetical protein
VGKNKNWRCEAAFFAYFLCGGKESKCRPAQGQHLRASATSRMPAKAEANKKTGRCKSKANAAPHGGNACAAKSHREYHRMRRTFTRDL